MPCCAAARVKEQCGFNSTPDPFNGQTANFILEPPKVIESRIYVKKSIWSAIETTLFYYSSNMYNWSSLVAKKSFTFTLKIITNLGKCGFLFSDDWICILCTP